LSATEEAQHADVRDLARFGHPQELRRVLGIYSNFAVAFSYISPSTGIFTLYATGLGLAGPAFFWSWPLVAFGQLLVALNFAEVSSHFPVAGSVYQWTKYLSNRHYSWFTGWIYLFAGILTVAGVMATIPLLLLPFLKGIGMEVDPTSLNQQRNVAVLTLISTTLLSIFGVRLVSIINNTGVVFEILGMVIFALILLIFYHHQDASVLLNGHQLTANGVNPTGTFLAAMFMSLFVIFGFDTASTLAEETKNPRREAPRAVLLALGGAFVIGTIFLIATVIAIPGNIDKYVANTAAGNNPYPLQDIIQSNFPGWLASVFLLVVSAAVYVCCLAIQTATIRLAFGMARDHKLPLGRVYNKVSPTLHTPVGTCIVIGVLAAIPFLYYAGAGTIAVMATGMIYISYLLANLAILLARFRGWPAERTPFKLGSWGTIINIAALVWGASMIANFMWPRDASVGASNPNFNTLPNLPSWLANSPLGHVPLFELVLGVILLVGVIYYAFAQRNMPETQEIKSAEAVAS
jgi:urea carboxylase system permease